MTRFFATTKPNYSFLLTRTAALISAAALVLQLIAQQTGIAGRVSDPSKAVVANVAVTAIASRWHPGSYFDEPRRVVPVSRAPGRRLPAEVWQASPIANWAVRLEHSVCSMTCWRSWLFRAIAKRIPG
jgi:hypothetical protein